MTEIGGVSLRAYVRMTTLANRIARFVANLATVQMLRRLSLVARYVATIAQRAFLKEILGKTMTDEEHDEALLDLVDGILKRLDTRPLHLGSADRQHHKTAGVTIPISDVLSEDDLINAIADVMRGLKLEFKEWDA